MLEGLGCWTCLVFFFFPYVELFVKGKVKGMISLMSGDLHKYFTSSHRDIFRIIVVHFGFSCEIGDIG